MKKDSKVKRKNIKERKKGRKKERTGERNIYYLDNRLNNG